MINFRAGRCLRTGGQSDIPAFCLSGWLGWLSDGVTTVSRSIHYMPDGESFRRWIYRSQAADVQTWPKDNNIPGACFLRASVRQGGALRCMRRAAASAPQRRQLTFGTIVAVTRQPISRRREPSAPSALTISADLVQTSVRKRFLACSAGVPRAPLPVGICLPVGQRPIAHPSLLPATEDSSFPSRSTPGGAATYHPSATERASTALDL